MLMRVKASQIWLHQKKKKIQHFYVSALKWKQIQPFKNANKSSETVSMPYVKLIQTRGDLPSRPEQVLYLNIP